MFAETIKRLRKAKGLSQRQLAYRAGVEPATMNSYEAGKHPNQPNARKVAAALKIAPEELFPEFQSYRS